MSEVDQMLEKARQGQSVLQFMEGDRSYYLVYLAGDFFLETYKFNRETDQDELHHVECVEEATARFALTSRYEN